MAGPRPTGTAAAAGDDHVARALRDMARMSVIYPVAHLVLLGLAVAFAGDHSWWLLGAPAAPALYAAAGLTVYWSRSCRQQGRVRGGLALYSALGAAVGAVGLVLAIDVRHGYGARWMTEVAPLLQLLVTSWAVGFARRRAGAEVTGGGGSDLTLDAGRPTA